MYMHKVHVGVGMYVNNGQRIIVMWYRWPGRSKAHGAEHRGCMVQGARSMQKSCSAVVGRRCQGGAGGAVGADLTTKIKRRWEEGRGKCQHHERGAQRKQKGTDLSTPSAHLAFHRSVVIASTHLLLMRLMSKAGSSPVLWITSCHS